MLISPAFARNNPLDTGSTGGGDALLIILGAIIVLSLVYFGQKKLRKRGADRGAEDQAQSRE